MPTILRVCRPVRGSRSARGLLLLLCLACWRGPIPVVHAHGAERGADHHLERHLLSFHRGHLQESYFAWHIHLLLPWERFDGDCDSEDAPASPDPLTHNGAIISFDSVSQALNDLCYTLVPAAWENQPVLTQRRLHAVSLRRLKTPAFQSFVESLLLTAPLCAVTGVNLC